MEVEQNKEEEPTTKIKFKIIRKKIIRKKIKKSTINRSVKN
jgi:hypothetical protein